MEIQFFLCSDQTLLDQRSNRASIVNLIEELSAPNFPAFHHQFTVTAIATRQPNEKQAQTRELVLRLGNNEILRAPVIFDFQNQVRTRAISEIQGLPLFAPGMLYVELLDGKKIIADAKIPISLAAAPHIAPAPRPVAAAGQVEKVVGPKKVAAKGAKKRAPA